MSKLKVVNPKAVRMGLKTFKEDYLKNGNKLSFIAQVKEYKKKQLACLDSEYEIKLITNDIKDIQLLDELSQADRCVKVVMSSEER